MLTNEKYVGDIIFQKSFCTDCISKKTKINRGEMDRYLVTDNHLAIIDRETFWMVRKSLPEEAPNSGFRKMPLLSLASAAVNIHSVNC